MNYVNYLFFRNNMSRVLDKVNDDHEPIVITRQNAKPAVIISLEDFHSYEETYYLMSSPKNANRLNRSIKEIEGAKTKKI
ncbi:MAG: type II toxin-antitoxin system prevent-host-death family antitoxin [Rickettsiaceae bacterium]|nr:type II toxin-antitoxin system prevent-host-death family antitoxin [Rickettsiaceae bacterium]